jgi:hypothetical protein
MRFNEIKQRLDSKCWTGKKIGNPKTKVKGGVRVNNCVPAESVSEGVAETLPMHDAVKVLRQYGADHFKTTSNELHFYKQGRPFSVDLIWGNEGERSVNLSQLNSATRRLKGQGVAGSLNEFAPGNGDDSGNNQISLETVAKIIAMEFGNNVIVTKGKNKDQPSFTISPKNQFDKKIRVWSTLNPRTKQVNPTYNTILYIDGTGKHVEKAKLSTYTNALSTAKLLKKQQGVAEGWGKSIKRASQGWGVGAAPDMVTPSGAVSAFKNMDGQRLANFVASRKDQSKPRKDSAGAFVDKVIDREMRQRGYGRVANKDEQGVAEEYNAEYDDEAGMADNNLETIERAVQGIDDLISAGDNLPEWCQEKIAVSKSMLVTVWDYMKSEEDRGANPELADEFDLIESIVNRIAGQNGVDAEMVWEDLESLSNDELYAFAVTSQLNEDWSKVNKKDKTDGMSQKAVNAYRKENPGSKLKTAVTTKPSKLKKGSKASKRRKSYCSRSKGQMNMHNISCAKTPDKAICKARRRWNC